MHNNSQALDYQRQDQTDAQWTTRADIEWRLGKEAISPNTSLFISIQTPDTQGKVTSTIVATTAKQSTQTTRFAVRKDEGSAFSEPILTRSSPRGGHMSTLRVRSACDERYTDGNVLLSLPLARAI